MSRANIIRSSVKLTLGLALSSLAVLFMLPFLWMLLTAFKTRAQVYASPPTWIPMPVSLENLQSAWRLLDFPLLMRNTLIIAFATALATIIIASLIGFALAMLPTRQTWWIILVMIFTLIIPPTVTLVPQFLLVSMLGWVDTYLPLIFAPAIGCVVYILLFHQYFKSLPREIFEVAEIDGCHPLRVYSQIAMPMARPVVALVGVFSFVGSWNDFLGPLIYLNSPHRFTLSLGLALFQSANQDQIHLMMPVALMALAPLVLLFVLAQRHIDTGIIGAFEP